MNKAIDVWEIAKKIEEIEVPLSREEISKYINKEVNGRKMTVEEMPSEILKIVFNVLGKINSQQRIFTVNLIQNVVDELQDQ